MQDVYIQGDKTIKDSGPRKDMETSERQLQDQVCDVICVAKDSSDGLEGVAFSSPMINFHDFNVHGNLIAMPNCTK